MNLPPRSSRQPIREPWTREKLIHERAITIGSSLEPGSISSYDSHLQSYIEFCRIHGFDVEPTVNTLSFYTVFMASHINPKSLLSYLSGIQNKLEPFFPNVREVRRNHLVKQTLAGSIKRRPLPTNHK